MANKIKRTILLWSVFLLIILGSASSILLISKKYFGNKTISPKEAAHRVLTMTNAYFIPEKNAILSGNPTEENGLYKVNLNVSNNILSLYLTKNGALLIFPNGAIDIAKFEESAKKQKKTEEAIPKAERPSVELFVMSLCPYGIKAENEILPIIKGFKEKIDFKIKFIVNVNGNSVNEVVSMHGNDEAREDARQAAIMRYYPDKLAPYIEKINKNLCIISCGAAKMEDSWQKAANELQMDSKKIESFAYGQEGLNLLKQNEADVKKYDAMASPTLVINGAKSSAVYHGAKAIQEAICSAFAHPTRECQKD